MSLIRKLGFLATRSSRGLITSFASTPRSLDEGVLTNIPSIITLNLKRGLTLEVMTDNTNRIVSYEDVLGYKDNPSVLLVDVREPAELQETGVIPASINIPLGDLPKVLDGSDPAEFQKKYGGKFPDKKTEIVFSCKMGMRASKAMEAALKMGYENAKFYQGSWADWASRQK